MTDQSPIREATVSDIRRMRDIYADFVENGAITFESTVPSVAKFSERVAEVQKKYPWLVYSKGEDIHGYAYATRHRVRTAYDWSTEISVYVESRSRRTGIATKLYESILRSLTLQGFRNVFAIITLPNEASVAFHNKLLFREIGLHKNAGYKFGEWHNVMWMQRELFERSDIENDIRVTTPLPFSKVRELVL